MKGSLADIRIIVADDQADVARTLCRPLHAAGARLLYVEDGRAAFREISRRPFDLALVDMKMPPGEWGGLWLLEELRAAGLGIPAISLSGEGAKQQVIQAIRLGAVDWINKDAASEELLDRCVQVLEERLAKALDVGGAVLPLPLALRLARYARTTDPDKRFMAGLHALEAVFRFAAILGLASSPPRPLSAVKMSSLAAPSMGTWFQLCLALEAIPDSHKDLARLISWLVPDRTDRSTVQELINVRNQVAHGRGSSSSAQRERLGALLRRFAHRASSLLRAELVVPTSMTFDGLWYNVDLVVLKGAGRPIPSRSQTHRPMVTGDVIYLPKGGDEVALGPWMVSAKDSNSEDLRFFHFDGLLGGRGRDLSEATFRYAPADDGDAPSEGPHAPPSATGEVLASWANAKYP
ncbi:response regulator [Micromonospora sp. NPDC023956]|uniref:response regulator n=1 Tax=Micromonospora sp. NPDC023956 TaxID=3155722 RepID=UPI0033D3FE93